MRGGDTHRYGPARPPWRTRARPTRESHWSCWTCSAAPPTPGTGARRRLQRHLGPVFPLVQADAERIPLMAGHFDLVVSEHGVAAWCDPERWLPEAARLLRPGGRLVFLTNSHLSALCVPAEEGVAGERLVRGQREAYRVRWVSWSKPCGRSTHRQTAGTIPSTRSCRAPGQAGGHGELWVATRS
jgi:SAM-dependent methyltransferase